VGGIYVLSEGKKPRLAIQKKTKQNVGGGVGGGGGGGGGGFLILGVGGLAGKKTLPVPPTGVLWRCFLVVIGKKRQKKNSQTCLFGGFFVGGEKKYFSKRNFQNPPPKPTGVFLKEEVWV